MSLFSIQKARQGSPETSSSRRAQCSRKRHKPFILRCRPYPFQQEILEKLDAERKLHGRVRNLVVAATGTGKTVIAAFDYARFKKEQEGRPARLLFVAHRDEILKQSLRTFQTVLRDHNFGDLLVGGSEPEKLDHLFVSIQSFNFARVMEPDSARLLTIML